jgi:hypothetical protein
VAAVVYKAHAGGSIRIVDYFPFNLSFLCINLSPTSSQGRFFPLTKQSRPECRRYDITINCLFAALQWMIISKADPCSGMQPSFSRAHDDLLKGHFRFDPTANVLSMLHMRTHLRALCHCQYVDLVCMSSTADIVGTSSCYQHLRCRDPLFPPCILGYPRLLQYSQRGI